MWGYGLTPDGGRSFIETQAEPLEHGNADVTAGGKVLENALAAAAVAVFVED
jgi:hypothetical protein